jgi:hypothetical protein
VTYPLGGNTMVEITYQTKYWLWDVHDTDVEKVQLLLVPA